MNTIDRLDRNAEGYFDPTAGGACAQIAHEERRQARGYMPLVYICSPYQGDIERNVQHTRRYCAHALSRGMLPIAPHLLFPQFMGDETPDTRDKALYMGLILLKYCHAIWFYGDHVSEGMKIELNRARLRGMVIRRFTTECQEVPI